MAPSPRELRLIGLDLDNTLIDYGPAYAEVAERMGLPDEFRTRDAIRGLLRPSSDDDEEWQRFQALLYTDGLEQAVVSPGARDLLVTCADRGIPVVIVSHKTARGPERFGARDLRAPAVEWLVREGVLDKLVPRASVHFLPTMTEKVATIGRLSPCAFVDDLDEVLSHPDFPSHVLAIHYVPGGRWSELADSGVQSGFEDVTAWVRSC